ncbi:hypothetical protein ABTO80_18350, partial [Acinetobacter baumannii]
MAIEERKPSENETNDQPVAAQATDARAAQGEDEEARPGGEVDFATILDQFEEQSSFQEGQIVQGKVVGVGERG